MDNGAKNSDAGMAQDQKGSGGQVENMSDTGYKVPREWPVKLPQRARARDILSVVFQLII